MRKMVACVVTQLGLGGGRSRFQDNKRVGRFSPALVRKADNSHLLHGGMPQQHAFHFYGGNVFAAANNYIF